MDQDHQNPAKSTSLTAFSNVSVCASPERFSKTETLALIRAVISVCGERRGASMEVLVDQWHDALRLWPANMVAEAWRGFRDANVDGYWPQPAHIIKRLRDQIPPSRETFKPEPEKDFCREGRNQAEELIYRAAECAKWRRDFGFNAPDVPEERPEAERVEPKPVSTRVSPALEAHARKNGYWAGDRQKQEA